ncbi:MAG: hypothetical protein A3E78_12010 [Alphaproteobacteria bacterium RIFCSPHIGHO2_12_FULL_63_12]|nr:MAG: hypothetical protein A3E78_12010 [Alphaproteobacteria bacterium RIFCSPHIGHO2_12_FULL_63_12]
MFTAFTTLAYDGLPDSGERPIDDEYRPMEIDAFRCQSLWRAVIQQAWEDMAWEDDGRPPDEEKRRRLMAAGVRARRWFASADEDFRAVCEMAGLAWGVVSAAARRLAAKRKSPIVEIGR